MNPKVDIFLSEAKHWQKEFIKLREIVLSCGLDEDLKWGKPCYMFEKRNIVLIHGFKEYCALLFFKGALLSDKQKILVQQTVNVKIPRQIRFTNLKEIIEQEKTVIAYINEAIKIEKKEMND
ncbi:MAG: DUF1801 domain-containing protein [Bacteroidales bacterium]|nr:DUF1801 domain-containing protein [Bacteroidales bacterium]